MLFLWILAILIIISDGQNYSAEHFWKMVQSQTGFVLDAWRVEHAWVNPSLALSPDEANKIIMVWRMPDKGKHSKMGYMWMDVRNWKATKGKDMIEIIKPHKWRTSLIGEDPRIFYHNGRAHIVYNHHLSRFKKIFYAELFYSTKEDMFYTIDPPNHMRFENEDNLRHQKNWSPFDFYPGNSNSSSSSSSSSSISVVTLSNDSNSDSSPNSKCAVHRGVTTKSCNATLLFIYSIRPHRVLQAYPMKNHSSPSVQIISGEFTAETMFVTELLPQYRWRWGEMRGGTPALLMGDSYLTFFHSSGHLNHRHIGTYVMGAYLFERNPPFAITHMSAEPIFHESFINESYGWAYKGVDFVVFPMGFTFDEDFIFVSYGKNDRDGWIVKLNRSAFWETLKPVQSKLVATSDWDQETGLIARHSLRHVSTG